MALFTYAYIYIYLRTYFTYFTHFINIDKTGHSENEGTCTDRLDCAYTRAIGH